MPQSVPLPTVPRAVDDPLTRTALLTTWRRGLVRLVTWTAVWMSLLLAVILIDDRDLETVRAVFLLLMFAGLRPLALASLSMQCVRSIDTALGNHPWRPVASVRRVRGAGVRGGIAVRMKAGDGEDEWTPVMKARAPFRWRRWTAEMEHGAWFAGDPERGGVLALPGGRALTLVTAG
ncbi:hypothetical protein SUDANB6_03525 [Streptomyces sp. enrichment culture]|uniref:hypothetical protein n=1 Tax=Streptomyces sp. enrichment culture TaxID=1795815 RepID=UPI003F55A722